MLGIRGRGFVARIAAGCLLGAATAAALAPTAGARATAAHSATAVNACQSINVNDDGWDYYNIGYGNKGDVYINTSSVINSLHEAIFRNFFVTGDANNYVEGGWTAHNGGYNNPTVYAEWKNLGMDSNPQFYTGYGLTPNTDKVFTVENVGFHNIFRFYVDNQSNPFNYSPIMNFGSGYLQTNSERYNSCDSMYAHFYNLSYYDSSSWTSSYNNLECYITQATGWFFNKTSNSDHTINQVSGKTC